MYLQLFPLATECSRLRRKPADLDAATQPQRAQPPAHRHARSDVAL